MAEFVVIVVCLFFNALLAAAEMAFVTVARPQLRDLAKSGNKDARRIVQLRENPERTLSVIQVGITLVGAIAAAVGGAGAEEMIAPSFIEHLNVSENTAETLAIAVVVLPLTYLNVVIGELVPKTLALRHSLTIVLRAARWLALFDRVLTPIVSALEWSTKQVMRLFYRRPVAPAPPADETVELNQLSTQTRQYVLNLVNIEQKRLRDVYLPWDKVIAIDRQQPLAEVESVVVSSGHTRMPVVDQGEVVGVLNTKEFIALRQTGSESWQGIVRPMLRVRDGEPLLKVLRQMQENRSHMCTVFAGAVPVGMVTMEDILEEVIGDVFDEDDDGALKRILSTSPKLRSMGPRSK